MNNLHMRDGGTDQVVKSLLVMLRSWVQSPVLGLYPKGNREPVKIFKQFSGVSSVF